MAIKNIIYDFGGVIYEINYHRAFSEFLKIANNPEEIFDLGIKEFANHQIFIDYETGKTSEETFLNALIAEFDLKPDHKAVRKAFNALLIDFFPDVYDIIESQKEKYSISLLSNTNKIHFDYYSAQKPEIFDLFDHKFLSFELKARKPHIEIFQKAIEICNYNPSETLFADDLQENIDGAAKAGFKTFLIDKSNNIKRLSKALKNGKL